MATTATTRVDQGTAVIPPLFLAFELGVNKWQLGFTTGAAQRPRERQVPAGDSQLVLEEIRRAKRRCGFPEEARGVSGYEAGRDGLWLHRFFVSQGVANSVVDSASMEVNRRHRRAKTDRLEVHKLLTMLLRHTAGEKQVWSVVRVPSVVEEDRRQLPRELLTTKRDRTRVSNRIKGLLAGCGIRMRLPGDVGAQLEQVRQWDGSSLPAALLARLQREWQKVPGLTAQIAPLEAERRVALRTRREPAREMVRQLMTLGGLGVNSAWLFVREFFAWRDVQTPKQVGALAGLTPTPYQSGQASRELGITKAGNGSRRTMAIEIAWGWGRFQPESTLTQWYQARFGQGSARLRKIGLVALARKLLIALWRVLQTGERPAGAILKAEVSDETIPKSTRFRGEGARVEAGVGNSWRGTGSPREPIMRRGGPPRASQAPRAPAGSGAWPSEVTTERRAFGAGAPRITKPPAPGGRHAPVGSAPGTSSTRGEDGNKKGLTSAAT
jgi:transposase